MRLKNGFAVSQHLEIFKELCICIKNTQVSTIRVILQARKQMQSLEPGLVKEGGTSKSGTTSSLTAGCLPQGAKPQCPELGGRTRCLVRATQYLHKKWKDTQEQKHQSQVWT